MPTVTKKHLVDRITEVSGCGRSDVKLIVQCFLDQMIEELASGNRLEFRDFGVLEIKSRAARVAQNPKTLERVNVPEKRTVKFKMGRLLKERLTSEQRSTAPGKPEVVVKVKSPRGMGRAQPARREIDKPR